MQKKSPKGHPKKKFVSCPAGAREKASREAKKSSLFFIDKFVSV